MKAEDNTCMRFSILGSGSRGNAAVVESEGLRLMIDAGLSSRQLVARLKAIGIDPSSLDGILLTHEHGDHVRGLKVFLRQFQIPVYASPHTAHVVKETGINGGQWKHFEPGHAFEIGGTRIEPFSTQHDAVDPVGFVVANSSRRFGLVSDAGDVCKNMTDRLRGCDGLFVEANYDCKLLEADIKRPWSIKQRISSRHGHLSNAQVATLMTEICHPALARIVLGHLSSDCNTPEIALNSLRACLEQLGRADISIHCAAQEEPTEWFHLS